VSPTRALPYSRFLEILVLLECSIPFLPSEPGREFLIFRWGATGYFSKSGGPSAPFIHRELDEWVPVKEIHKTINFLHIKQKDFWYAVDGCQVNPLPTAPEVKKTG
jgi:hypothetical protein